MDPWFRSTIDRWRYCHLVAEDPDRYLVLGPDRAGRFLELIVLDRPAGPAVIHAMEMRQQYQAFLKGER